jgi:hypothetical protein
MSLFSSLRCRWKDPMFKKFLDILKQISLIPDFHYTFQKKMFSQVPIGNGDLYYAITDKLLIRVTDQLQLKAAQ